MDRDAERKAFARACRYLNFRAIARWTALVSAAGTGLLYVALLVVLWLFADLMVHRGRIPFYRDLAGRERDVLLQRWDALPTDRVVLLLKSMGVEEEEAATLPGTEVNELDARQRELVWRVVLHEMLQSRVGSEAAAVASGESLENELTDLGVLSLVVRTDLQSRFTSPVVGFLARWNGWMWKYGNTWCLGGLLILAAFLALLRSALAFVNHEAAAVATIEAGTRLRRAVYHHTFRLGALAVRALGPSEAVSIFTRHVEAVSDALYARLTVMVSEPIKFGLLLALALVIHFWLALAFLLFALLVWLVGGQLAAYFRKQGRLANSRAAEQLSLIRESLMLMRLVKVYLMELFNQSRVERQLARYAGAQRSRYRGEAMYRPLLFFLGMLAAIVLLFVAGLLVLHGQLGVASGITLATALVSMYWPLERWLDNRRFGRRGRESAVILFRFLDRPGEVGQVVGAAFVPPLNKQLEFDNVNLREPGTGRVLLQGVTFTIQAGQHVAVIGSEELEKHALVYLIPRFLDPTSGEIRIDQHNLRWVTLDSLRAQIAIVMQHNLVFHDSVANNISCGDPGFSLPQIMEAAKVAHAHHFIQKLPRGYETAIGELGHTLTISEQFRIALARAILRDPALLIVEEPATPLDEDTKSLLDDTFTRVLTGRTVVFLPHRISTIKSCDRVFLLHKGRVEASGEHRELLAENPLYRHLHYLEFNELAEQV